MVHSAPANLENLVKNSPFNGPAATPAEARGEVPLEFRGVLVDGGEYFFSLFDPATRSSMWVGLNEPGNPFTVREYDRVKGVAVVEHKGRTLTLALKQSKVAALAPGAPAIPAPAGAPPSVAAANPADDANRLAAVAEEIRRRRALRVQQGAPAPPPADKPSTTKPNQK